MSALTPESFTASQPQGFKALGPHEAFLEGLGAATERLRNFMDKAGKATLVGDVFDDAATGQGLLNFFVRGLSCGALTIEDALDTGLTQDELHGRSFLEILEARRR